MEERNIKVSLEKAKKWYRGNDSSLKELALQAFTKEELEKKELPKTWKEWVVQNTEFKDNPEEYIESLSAIEKATIGIFIGSGLLETKEQVEIMYILIKLIRLRDTYRQGWRPNWTDGNFKYSVISNAKTLEVEYYYAIAHIFSFQTKELAKQFIKNFKEDLEKLRELL